MVCRGGYRGLRECVCEIHRWGVLGGRASSRAERWEGWNRKVGCEGGGEQRAVYIVIEEFDSVVGGYRDEGMMEQYRGNEGGDDKTDTARCARCHST